MKIHLVKHDKSGLGYALTAPQMVCKVLGNRPTMWRVRFWQKIEHEVYFPPTCFKQGDLIDLGVIDDTEKLDLFS